MATRLERRLPESQPCPDIRFNKKEIARVEGELHRMMNLLDYQLETMPGIDLVTASALVAEIGDIHRFASADKLARFAGISPVKLVQVASTLI